MKEIINEKLEEILFFWYQVFCHEIAHVKIPIHNKPHYTLSKKLEMTYLT